MKKDKKIIIVGDRVLIKPDEARARTNFGLYLPQGIESKESVQGGYVEKVGPGYLLPDPQAGGSEPWDTRGYEPKYLPLQVEDGDYALFIRKAAVEIELDREKYLIVPQAAILMIIRDDILEQIGKELND